MAETDVVTTDETQADAPESDESAEFDPSAYGSGTYFVAGHGLVANGQLVDSPDAAVEAGWDKSADGHDRSRAPEGVDVEASREAGAPESAINTAIEGHKAANPEAADDESETPAEPASEAAATTPSEAPSARRSRRDVQTPAPESAAPNASTEA